MLTTLITKAIVGTDAIVQETLVKGCVIKEVSGLGHDIIKQNMPAFKESLKEKVLAKITAQLNK